VENLENDSSQPGEVDHKLIDLARQMGAKIVTNDFNLNKVATVQDAGAERESTGQCAQTRRAAGRTMRVLILREKRDQGSRTWTTVRW
jgi:uncharacterized protein YacL